MNKLRKNQNLGYGLKVKSDNFFDKRREVIQIIRELKESGFSLPRIEVKIVDREKDALGLGYVGKNIIAIGADLEGIHLYSVVLHEIVHAVFGYASHNEKCILMKSCKSDEERASYTKEQYLKEFTKYDTQLICEL